MGDWIVRTMKSALIATALFFGASSCVNAADVYERGSFKDTPSYLPAITWTGFYVGVHAGSTFNDDVELVLDVPELGRFSSGDLELDEAFIGGVHVGYNWHKPSNLVFGIEGTLSFLDDDDLTDYLATIRGRIGVAMDRSLLYATGGVAFLGYNEDLADLLEDDPAIGFVVGAGLEHKLTNNFSVGVEGLYYDVSSEFDLSRFGDGADGFGLDFDRNFWTVQARLNYHFGSGYETPLK